MARRESKQKALDRYRAFVREAIRWRDEQQYDSLWWRMIDLYRGRQVTQLSVEDRIVVNLCFGTLNVISPSVSVNNPKITVAANKPEDEDRAVIIEGLINYQWRHFNFQPQFRLAVKDWLMLGHAWCKVGYTYAEEPVPLTVDEMGEQYDIRRAEADAYAADYPELAADLPTDEDIYEHLSDTQMQAVVDQPYVERVSPFDMFVDPAATTLEDARWIAQRIVRPLSEVRNDKSYNRNVRKSVQGDMYSYTQRDDRSWRWRDQKRIPELEYSTVWEFYDLSERTLCVWAEGSDSYLVDPHDFPYTFGHPYVMLRNYDVPEYFYPMGELESIESLQYELNKTRSQTMQARKKFARKYLFRESAFGSEGRQALNSDEDNTMVPVADEGTPFEDVIQPLPQVPLPPDLYQYSAQIEQDIATVSGVSEYQRGQIPETRRTATEAAIISDSVNARAADKLAVIESSLGIIARRVVQLCQQFVTGDQVYGVEGSAGLMVWVPWSRDEIQGEYDFTVEAGSTQPLNETVRRQTAVALSQVLTPFVQMGVINPQALAKHLLQFGFGIKNTEKFMMAVPAPGLGPPEAAPGGVGGLQGPPMGGGYIDQETGNTATQEAEQAPVIPPAIRQQLAGQVGLPLPT